jgi:hypothetical protein
MGLFEKVEQGYLDSMAASELGRERNGSWRFRPLTREHPGAVGHLARVGHHPDEGV